MVKLDKTRTRNFGSALSQRTAHRSWHWRPAERFVKSYPYAWTLRLGPWAFLTRLSLAFLAPSNAAFVATQTPSSTKRRAPSRATQLSANETFVYRSLGCPPVWACRKWALSWFFCRRATSYSAKAKHWLRAPMACNYYQPRCQTHTARSSCSSMLDSFANSAWRVAQHRAESWQSSLWTARSRTRSLFRAFRRQLATFWNPTSMSFNQTLARLHLRLAP